MSFELKSEFGNVSQVSLNNIIIKSDTIPVANTNNYGKIYMFSGSTNQNFVHGYIYECVLENATYDVPVSFEPSGIGVDSDDFASFLQDMISQTSSTCKVTDITNGSMTYIGDDTWKFTAKDKNNNTLFEYQQYQQDFVDAGFVFLMPSYTENQVLDFTCDVRVVSGDYVWQRIDVQPIYEGIESEVIQQIQQDNSVINIALNNDIKNYIVAPTADGQISITKSSKIVDGKLSYFYLFVDMRAGTCELTWANNIQWGNTSPTMTAMVVYMFSFQTIDGGKTWVGNQMFSWLPNN